MVKRKVAQNRHGSGEAGPTKSEASSFLSPKTPGWKAANAAMFAEPLPTPKSQVGTRRMTRRASVYQAGSRSTLNSDISPISTRSRRSMYVKRLQSPKKTSRKSSRARDLAVTESLEEIKRAKRGSVKVTKSKTLSSSRSRSNKRGSDISVDINIRMPSIQGLQNRRPSRSAKQSYSDSVLLSSSASTVAESEMSEQSVVLKKVKSPRRRSGKTTRNSKSRSKRKSMETDDDVTIGSVTSSATTLPDDDDDEISFKTRPLKSSSKIPTRSRRKSTTKPSQSPTLSSVTSLESIDITLSEPQLSPSRGKSKPHKPLSATSLESIDITLSEPQLSPSKDKSEQGDQPSKRTRKSYSATSLESIDISLSTPKVSQSSRKPERSSKKSKSAVRAVSSNDSIDITYSTPQLSPGKRRPKNERSSRKPRKSVSQDDLNADFRTPAALQDWSPYKKQSERSMMHDVAQQASFTTPDRSISRTSRSSKKPMRNTPRKAVKILGKTTPTSKPIKRIKTPGRMTPARKTSDESQASYSTRKRRGSSTQFYELSSPKRARSRQAPAPSWFETWCTIL